MQRWLKIFFVTLLLFPYVGPQQAIAVEPAMADYTHYPIFQLNAVEPNILIILDNSGSMNFNAYGSWPGNGGIVTDAPFLGEPYRGVDSITVSQASDDAEESGNYTYDHNDLDFSPYYTVGMRFGNLSIPKGALILSAHITFKASTPMNGNNAAETTVTFRGQASDNAGTFAIDTYDSNISSRPDTAASVVWDIRNPWTTGLTYQSPDLSQIIQEIVNRGGWSSGNALALKATCTNGYREVAPYPDPDGPTLEVRYLPQPFSRYYGYFNPDYFYYWNSNKFDHKYKKIAYVGDPSAGGYWSVTDLSGNPRNLQDSEIVSAGLWDGNWLNWVSMRRVDVLRKVLMGGQATARTGGGNQTNYGEIPPASAEGGREFIKRFISSVGSAVSPYDGDYHYGMKGGSIYVDDDSSPFSGEIAQFRIAIQKNILYEPQDFYFYDTGNNLAGVLQKVGNKARWGNEWFNKGTGNNESGGLISNTIGVNIVPLVNDIQIKPCDSWTPLAEAYYVAMQYFKQEDVQTGLDYPNNAVPNDNVGQDPFYMDGAYLHCADSFVILLTDGASTKDAMIPDSLKNYDPADLDNTSCNESTGVNCDYPDGGTDYLDDIALYARTSDLRADLPGSQNMVLYTIYAFGSEANARSLLRNASKNGGFDDRNGNNIPDLDAEWDKDLDGNPDTFFEADDGYKLEAQLIRTINEILARAASGTAVSVLSTTGDGEGNIYQAYFRPVVPVGLTEEVNWVGHVQSLWVDTFGNLREDTVNDALLNVQEDRIISYYLDPATGDTRVKRFAVSAANPYPNVRTGPYETVKLEEVSSLWEAGKRLSERVPDSTTFKRKIFTYLDKDKDHMVDESTYNPWDSDGEAVEFSLTSASAIKPYLGLKDDLMWSYLGTTHDQRVSNLISYIRGNEISGLRSRTIDDKVWKLGDIVYSTPTPISTPPDNYHLIYRDQSYRDFFEAQKNRETVVYLGANDGMLHAFTSWQRNATTGQYEKPLGVGAPAEERIGDEIWAYIPQSLLPHLKWLPSLNYTHVDYVDLKPKIFDAKIDHDNNASTAKEWRTLLLAGLNMGGKYIWAEGAFDNGSGVTVSEIRNFYPSYTCIDITEPRNPKLLWERSYTDVGLTTSIPAAIKVKDKWFLVFGSGPTAYDGTSTKNGHVFIVDLETGNPYRNGTNDWLFQTGEANAFMNSPVSLDKNLDFNVDAIYFGETYLSGSWKGKIYKVTVPSVDGLGNYDVSSVENYIDNPLNSVKPWTLSSVFNALKPITAPVSLSMDPFDNAWIFVGSGRYLSTPDKTDTDTQYIFGIKDPFYNKDHTPSGLYHTNYYHNYSSSVELGASDLFDAGPYIVISGGTQVFNTSGDLVGSFNDILNLARLKDGWYRTLTDSGERVLNKSTLIGGIVLTPSFVPDGDVCAFGGDSYLYGLYYETGTPYRREVFAEGTDIENIGGMVYTKILGRISLGAGKASAVGIHVGKDGAKSLVQQSTGAIVTEAVTPAFTFTSGMRSWIQK